MAQLRFRTWIMNLVAVLGGVFPIVVYYMIAKSTWFYGDCRPQDHASCAVSTVEWEYAVLAIGMIWSFVAVKGLLLRSQEHRARRTVLGLIGAVLWLVWGVLSVFLAFGGRMPARASLPTNLPAEAAQSGRLQNAVVQDFVGSYSAWRVDYGESIDIKPDLTFCHTIISAIVCSKFRDVGRVVPMANHVEFVSRFSGAHWGMIPIRWGARRYLVRPSEIPQFCEEEVCSGEVSDGCRGGTARTSGEYFVRGGIGGAEVVPVEALPTGPEGAAVCP